MSGLIAAIPPRARLLPRLAGDPVAACALGLAVLMVVAAIAAPWIAPTDPADNDLSLAMQPPGAGLWLGRTTRGATW